jgi:molybdopterin/thiamine biosynthesis adenylyltransferase
MAFLTSPELERYDRQIRIAEIGKMGQEKLKKARVFIAGAGGLGSPVSIYLAAAGVGAIRIVDRDRVDASNLKNKRKQKGQVYTFHNLESRKRVSIIVPPNHLNL